MSGLAGALAISAGSYHTCAILADGTASCWGYNGSGQLGNGTTVDELAPTPVPELDGATGIAAGQLYSCALVGDGSGYCWGYNFHGQLGDGTTTDRLTPVAVVGL